jgi:hypothetical protein
MNQHNFGEFFEGEPRRSSRPSRSSTRIRRSYNEDDIAPDISDMDFGDANACTYPCHDFLNDAGIHGDFLHLVEKAGLTSYMRDEVPQYALLTKIFTKGFKLKYREYGSTVSFKIYDRPIVMLLIEFCSILGLGVFGADKKISNSPAELAEVYREVPVMTLAAPSERR